MHTIPPTMDGFLRHIPENGLISKIIPQEFFFCDSRLYAIHDSRGCASLTPGCDIARLQRASGMRHFVARLI